MYGQADTSTHGDAVEVCDIRFGICSDEVIESVFKPKVVLRRVYTGFTVLDNVVREVRNIAAGAEGFGAGTTDDDY